MAAFAQTVRWEPADGQLGFNQVSELALVFENCEPELGKLKMPPVEVDGLKFDGQPSQSTETRMVNWKTTHRYSLAFPVRPTKRTAISIPEFEVATDKGLLRVKAASFTVGEATVGGTGLTLDDISSAKLVLPKNTFWAGEVFPVSFNLSIIRRYLHQFDPRIEWQPTPLVTEEWSKPEPTESMVRGERRVVIEQSTRAYVKEAGNFTVKPASQHANIVVGQSGFGLFSSPSVEQCVFSSKPIDISVRALPLAPPGFNGTVGRFTLSSKIIPTTPAVGEPVTWTLELSGVGNWPDLSGLPQRDVSNDFQVVQPKSKRTMQDNTLFEGTLVEDVVLVPSKPGSYTLGPVKFTYFNTETGSYQTITTEAVTVSVSTTPIHPAAPHTTGAPVQFSLNLPAGNPTTSALPNAVPPVPPENLPREPLSESHRSCLPYPLQDLWLIATLPALAAVLLVWLTLSALRSRALDPQRHRRAAHAELSQLLAGMSASDSQRSALSTQLVLWQQHTAALWEIPHAAPGAALVQANVATHSGDNAAAWTELWSESDRTLHGPTVDLSPEWITRATDALQAVKIPGWNPFSLFAGRHLFPFLSVLFILSVLSVPSSLAAATPAERYRSGEFTAAEKDWRTAIATAPTDWSARHNLGLALAQQDRWLEALAHWSSAFLLKPSVSETRTGLALGLQRSGLAPAELVAFSQGKGRHQLARYAAPGEWQLILVSSSLLIAAALILLLLQGYGLIDTWAKPAALTSILVAIVLAAAASFSLRTYGQLAHPDAVFVWQASVLRSIPTEADTTQKTTPLSAGSLAVADKTFLGWSHLSFPAGQTGWVRSEVLIRLYR